MHTHFWKNAGQKHCFSNNESFIFHDNNLASFESVFCMKTAKSRLFKKHLKRKKLPARFCLFLGFLHISENELFKTAFLLVQRLMEEEKEKEKFVKTLTFIFPIFDKCDKGKLDNWIRLILVHLRKYYKIMCIRALLCFLTYFYFLENLHINF